MKRRDHFLDPALGIKTPRKSRASYPQMKPWRRKML
jgi:hypothetical protein